MAAITPERAKFLWRSTLSDNTTNEVGRFFEQLAQRVVGGHPDEEGNIDLVTTVGDQLVGVEVKATGDHHARLATDQLDGYLTTYQGWPYEGGLVYAIFTYRARYTIATGRHRGKRRSRFNSCQDEAGVRAVLAESVESLYLLDSHFLELLRRELGTHYGMLAGQNDRETLVVPRGLLRRLWRIPDRNGLYGELGTAIEDWVVSERSVRLKFPDIIFPIEFGLIQVLNREHHDRIGTGLCRRGRQRARQPS